MAILRPAGDFDRTYRQDMAVVRKRWQLVALLAFIVALFALARLRRRIDRLPGQSRRHIHHRRTRPEHPDWLHGSDFLGTSGLYDGWRLHIRPARWTIWLEFLLRLARCRSGCRSCWTLLRTAVPPRKRFLPGHGYLSRTIYHSMGHQKPLERSSKRRTGNQCPGTLHPTAGKRR